MELPYDPGNSLLGKYTKKPKTLIQNNLGTPVLIALLFIIAKIWKQPKQLLINEGIKKLWHIYTMQYYSVIKKGNIRLLFKGLKNKKSLPWLVWLSGLSTSLQTKRVTSSIPSQGTCLGCGPGPWWGVCKRQPHANVSLPLFLPPLPYV